jgi:microsomal dipeptidase-like Zn-dependent dipeptidase
MPYWLSNYSDENMAKQVGSLNDVVRTVRYIYKICGHSHKHIGIGTDFAGYIPPPRDMKCHGHIELLRKKLLLEFDHDEGIVEDIMANNAIRFLTENWRSG